MEHWAQKCDGAGCCPAEYSAVCRERDELRAALATAQAELEHAKQERDAAVADMRQMLDNCKASAHQDAAPADCDCECMGCEKPCACHECRDGSHFEWHGMKEEVR